MHTPRQSPSLHQRERGAALMIMLIILVVGIAAVLVSSLNSSAINIARDKTTAQALAQAKEALIGYAITYADTHSNQVDGYLPCPDNGTGGATDEGSSDTCTGKDISTLGRLPWKTLDLEPLRDGYGECLWYAVSGTYQNNPKTDMMNWDTRGLLQVSDANGSTVSDVVAVIFAPGPTLSGQDRSASGTAPICGGNYTASNYLDSEGSKNNATVDSFYSGTSSQMNDRLIYITRQDIWNAMLKRSDFMTTLKTMTQTAAECIANYGKRNSIHGPYYPNPDPNDKRLPWSGRFYPDSNDFKTDWSYDDDGNTPLLAGRLPFRVNTSDNITDNQITSSSNHAFDYAQLAKDGSGCPDFAAAWSNYYPWWSNWKDHLYYAVSSGFSPSSSNYSYYYDWSHHLHYSALPHCGTCVEVNGNEYAAVVIFAGQVLAGQSRATAADHLDPSNYLENPNLTNVKTYYKYGNRTYQGGTSTSSFNDVLYCIKEDLSVVACP